MNKLCYEVYSGERAVCISSPSPLSSPQFLDKAMASLQIRNILRVHVPCARPSPTQMLAPVSRTCVPLQPESKSNCVIIA